MIWYIQSHYLFKLAYQNEISPLAIFWREVKQMTDPPTHWRHNLCFIMAAKPIQHNSHHWTTNNDNFYATF